MILPDAAEKQKTSTRPFIIDPNYLLENMQASTVEKAESIQYEVENKDKQTGAALYEYLEKLGV